MDSISSEAYNAAFGTSAWHRRNDLTLIRVYGSEGLDYLNRITTNELRDLRPMMHRQTILCSDKGRIVDVLHVLVEEQYLTLLVSKSGVQLVGEHLRKYAVMDDVRFELPAQQPLIVEWLGPQSQQAMRFALTSLLESTDSRYVSRSNDDGIESVVLPLGTLPEAGSLVISYADADAKQRLLERFASTAHELEDAVYEVLRIEAGIPKESMELNEEHNPLEANLLHLVNFKKGCYIGQEVIARLDSYNKVKQRLVGLRVERSTVSGSIIEVDGQAVGQISSAAESPRFGAIALGYIRTEHALEGKECLVKDIEGLTKGRICILPFS